MGETGDRLETLKKVLVLNSDQTRSRSEVLEGVEVTEERAFLNSNSRQTKSKVYPKVTQMTLNNFYIDIFFGKSLSDDELSLFPRY